MLKRSALILLTLIGSSCLLLDDFRKVNLVGFESSEPASALSRLDAHVEMGVGRLTIQPSAPSQAYEVDLIYNEAAYQPQVDYSERNGQGSFRFRLKGTRNVRNSGKNELNLSLNPKAALNLRAELGVGTSEISLSGMKVESLQISSGVGRTSLSMLEPNPITCRRVEIESGVGSMELSGLGNLNFETFKFEGGVGGSYLDFRGQWEKVGQVEIEVGVGGVDIVLPHEIGAEVRASASFLSGINLEGFRKQGGVYLSRNHGQAEKIVKIRIETGIGGVNLTWK